MKSYDIRFDSITKYCRAGGRRGRRAGRRAHNQNTDKLFTHVAYGEHFWAVNNNIEIQWEWKNDEMNSKHHNSEMAVKKHVA